jgi:hypothetical protein
MTSLKWDSVRGMILFKALAILFILKKFGTALPFLKHCASSDDIASLNR